MEKRRGVNDETKLNVNRNFMRNNAYRRPLGHSRSLKVTSVSSDQEPVCDFLLVNIVLTDILSRTVFKLSRHNGQTIVFDTGASI